MSKTIEEVYPDIFSDNSSNSNKPIKVFRAAGIQIPIWETEGEYGPQFSCKISRSFKEDPDDDQSWRETPYVGGRDIANTISLLQMAASWVYERQAQAKSVKSA